MGMFPEVSLRRPRVMLAVLLLFFLSGVIQRSWALDAAALQAMVIVEGEEGRGSGFVVKMDGRTFLVTNSHVVRGNRNVKFRNLRNAEIPAGSLEIADQVDAVRAAIDPVPNALDLEPNIDRIKIGDEVVVAGNAEGAGVIREIPGKVVGVGPDRIEVDAEFVPGNSGSPILLKSSGKVIGIATYVYVPRGRVGAKSPFSLNEVRRFGYRLDTVSKWIAPSSKEGLVSEGLKLAELEHLIGSITRVLDSNAAFVAKWGASSFVSKDQAKQYPAFAALSGAIDGFVRDHTANANDEARKKNATAFFAKLKGILDDETKDLKESQFSGFYAAQLKECLGRFKDFTDWYDGTAMPAYRETWLTSQSMTAGRANAPLIDPTKFKLTLSDKVFENEPADNCHHVSYPSDSEPANLEGLYWIIVDPNGEQRSIQMHRTSVRVRTPIGGTYRVYVEFRATDKPKQVSNVVEVKYNPGDAGLAGNGLKFAPLGSPVDGKVPAATNITIMANSPDATPITDLRKGTKITLQYLKGNWKSWGRYATGQPDDPKTEGGDSCRVAITLPSKDGKAGDVLAVVPPDTRTKPYVFEVPQDYASLVLRINSKDNNFGDNPGKVDYKLTIQPPGTTVVENKATDDKQAAPLGFGRTMLLVGQNETRWQPSKGEWKIDKESLTGDGDSITTCRVTAEPPFSLEFKIKVLKGMRPRVKVGSLTFANEGYKPTFALYPPGRDAGVVPYELNQTYNVALLVTHEATQMYIDRRLVSTGPGIAQAINSLEFHGGDSWSKGTTEFRDVSVLRPNGGLPAGDAENEEAEERSAFLTAPGKDIDAALEQAGKDKKRVLIIVSDPRQQHSFHLKATMSNPETKRLVNENFIVVFVSDADAKHVAGAVNDVSPAHPAWLLLRPDGSVVERGDAAMGADRGLKWIQRMIGTP